jgi:hypothetical protein
MSGVEQRLVRAADVVGTSVEGAGVGDVGGGVNPPRFS